MTFSEINYRVRAVALPAPLRPYKDARQAPGRSLVWQGLAFLSSLLSQSPVLRPPFIEPGGEQ